MGLILKQTNLGENAMQKADSFVENDIVVFDANGNAADSNMKFVLNEDNSLTLQITVWGE